MKRSVPTWLLILCLTLFLLPACGVRRAPDLARIFAGANQVKGKRPLIIIPGILGSRLINRKTNEVVWESAFRAKADDLALPVSGDLRSNRDDLIASEVIQSARLFRRAPEIYIYRQLVTALRDYAGYRQGDWDNPRDGDDADTFYLFPYDWRRDNVESAQELMSKIEALKIKLGRPDLRFNIIAHSMGGLVARYAAMYGASDLPDDSNESRDVAWAGAAHINKVFLFGAPNDGSMDALATLIDGYSIREGLRRRVPLLRNLNREDALTAPAIFQLLPHETNAKFLDENLKPIAVDLYDSQTWTKYGWSAFADEDYRRRFTQQRLNRQAGVDEGKIENRKLKGERSKKKDDSRVEPNIESNTDSRQTSSPEMAAGSSLKILDEYFAAALNRAKRFHQALDAPVTRDAPVTFYLFGGDCEETLSTVIITRDKRGAYSTLIAPRKLKLADGRELSRREVTRLMYEPGDGRVTRNSLLSLTNRNPVFANLYTVFACDLHSDVQKNLILQDNALTVILREAMN